MWCKLLTISVGLLVLAGALAFWSGDGKASARASAPVAANYVAAEGRVAVKPDQRAVLSAEVSGRIDQLLVDNLTPVHKGQVLAVLYNADLEKRIHETEESYRKAEAYYQQLVNGARREDLEGAAANVKKAESDLDLAYKNEARDQELFDEQIVAQFRLDATVAEKKRAESELEAARQRLAKLQRGERWETIDGAYAEMNSQKFALESLKATLEKDYVRSPLNGLVIRRYRNASEFADTGDPILEVANLTEMIVEAEVNEMDVGRVRTGLKAVVTSDAFPGQSFSGEVYEVSAALKKRGSDPDDPAVIIDQKILPLKVRFLSPVPLKLDMKVDLKIFLQ